MCFVSWWIDEHCVPPQIQFKLWLADIYYIIYIGLFHSSQSVKIYCVTWQCDNHINELLHTLRDHQITGNVIICGWGFRVRMIIFPMINEFYLVPASSKLPL